MQPCVGDLEAKFTQQWKIDFCPMTHHFRAHFTGEPWLCNCDIYLSEETGASTLVHHASLWLPWTAKPIQPQVYNNNTKYQKDKPFWVLLEIIGCQWHQLNHNFASYLHLAADITKHLLTQFLAASYAMQWSCLRSWTASPQSWLWCRIFRWWCGLLSKLCDLLFYMPDALPATQPSKYWRHANVRWSPMWIFHIQPQHSTCLYTDCFSQKVLSDANTKYKL